MKPYQEFDLSNELAPDLDWLLQSSQVSDAVLVGFLLRDYSADLLRLAQDVLGDAESARIAATQSIVQAVLNRHQYWGKISSRAWLYELVVKSARKLASPRNSGRSEKSSASIEFLVAGNDSLDPRAIPVPHFWPVISAFWEKQPLFFDLNYGLCLSLDEIGYILKMRPNRMQTELTSVQHALKRHQPSCPICSILSDEIPEMEQRLCAEMKSILQSTQLSEAERVEWQAEIQGLLEKSYKNRRFSFQAKETGLIILMAILAIGSWWFIGGPASGNQRVRSKTAPLQTTPTPFSFYYYEVKPGDSLQGVASKAGVSSAALIAINDLSKQPLLYPGQLLRLPGGHPQNWLITPAPRIDLPPPTPLAMSPSLADIQQRVEDSPDLWHSVWANVLVFQYGLAGYIGPPLSVTRKQVWITQPSHSRVLYGQLDMKPDVSYVIVAGHIYGEDFMKKQVFENLATNLIIDPDLKKLFRPAEIFNQGGSFKFVDSQVLSGRKAWVLDWSNEAGIRISRYWIDTEYGVILRVRDFASPNSDTALSEIIVSAIHFDQAIPVETYNPFLFKGSHFSKDAADLAGEPDFLSTSNSPSITGPTGHESPARVLPPAGFDPSQRRLAFQGISTAIGSAEPSSKVDVFADPYYLGSLPLGQGSTLACKRSPNGSLIAFENVLDANQERKIKLYWTDLKVITQTQTVLPSGNVSGDFAFSPDSRSIAFYGCYGADGACGVYLLDLRTREYRLLTSLKYADYFLWKPDGQYLGLVGDDSGARDWKYLVVEIQTGKIVYQGKFDWAHISPAADSPTTSWGVTFHTPQGGLDGCMMPP